MTDVASPEAGSKEEGAALTDEAILQRFLRTKNQPTGSQTLGFRLLSVNQAEKSVEVEFDPVSAYQLSGVVIGVQADGESMRTQHVVLRRFGRSEMKIRHDGRQVPIDLLGKRVKAVIGSKTGLHVPDRYLQIKRS